MNVDHVKLSARIPYLKSWRCLSLKRVDSIEVQLTIKQVVLCRQIRNPLKELTKRILLLEEVVSMRRLDTMKEAANKRKIHSLVEEAITLPICNHQIENQVQK